MSRVQRLLPHASFQCGYCVNLSLHRQMQAGNLGWDVCLYGSSATVCQRGPLVSLPPHLRAQTTSFALGCYGMDCEFERGGKLPDAE